MDNFLTDVFDGLPEKLKIAILAGCEFKSKLVQKGRKYILKIKTKNPVGVVKIDGKWLVVEKKN